MPKFQKSNGFKMKGFSYPGVSPIKDKFVKVGEKGKKEGIGPFEERQSMRSEGLKLVEGALDMYRDEDLLNDALANEMFDEGDELVIKAREGTVLDHVIKNSTVGGKKLK